MLKVLITGASGFIGQSLCHFLAEKGFQISVASRTKIDNLPAHSYHLIDDITQEKNWAHAVKKVDSVIHLASQAHGISKGRYTASQQDLNTLSKINVIGTRALAQASSKANVKHIIYLSSIKVNGEVTILKPFSENDLPAPEDSYGYTKSQAEYEVIKYCQDGRMSYTILRPPLVYGPSVKGNFLDLLKICETNFPLPFLGMRNQRSLIYIENLFDIINLTLVHPQSRNEIFLVRDGYDLSTEELIRVVRRSMSLAPHLLYCPPIILNFIFKLLRREKAYTRLKSSLQIDDKKFRSYFNWDPPFSVEYGIQKTVKWFLSHKKQDS